MVRAFLLFIYVSVVLVMPHGAGASSAGMLIAPKGHDSSHNRQLMHSAGDIEACHFDNRDIQFSTTP